MDVSACIEGSRQRGLHVDEYHWESIIHQNIFNDSIKTSHSSAQECEKDSLIPPAAYAKNVGITVYFSFFTTFSHPTINPSASQPPNYILSVLFISTDTIPVQDTINSCPHNLNSPSLLVSLYSL